jgi:hypothetical protein
MGYYTNMRWTFRLRDDLLEGRSAAWYLGTAAKNPGGALSYGEQAAIVISVRPLLSAFPPMKSTMVRRKGCELTRSGAYSSLDLPALNPV